MPPKVKVSEEEVVRTALEIARTRGAGAINARSVAEAIGCSTQPIFRSFDTVEELVEATRREAYRAYFGFIEKEVASGKYPQYKAFGMAYVRFANEEKELFKFLLMCERGGVVKSNAQTETEDFEASVQMIMENNAVSREVAERMHLEMWCVVHGIGTMLATSFQEFSYEDISGILSDVYRGLQVVHSVQETKG